MFGHLLHSLRYRLIAASILVLLILFTLVSFNTQRLLEDFALENTRNLMAQTSETLNLAVVPHTTQQNLKTLDAYLNELILGDENGIVYLTLSDEAGQTLASSHRTPDPLPIVNSDLSEQLVTGVVHAEQAILLADNRVGNLRYGLSTRLLQQTTTEIFRKNLLLIATGLIVIIIALVLVGLRITTQLERLMKSTKSLAQGDYQVRAPESGKNELSSLAHYFNQMADAVSEREHELRENQQRYCDLVENTHDWIWEVDAEARFTYVSPRVKEFLGYEPEEVLGKTPFDLMPDDEARRVAAVFSEIAKQHMPFNALENINLHRDGHRVVLETSGTPVFAEGGEFLGYRGTDRDITDRKANEEALRASEERFELALQAANDGLWDWNVQTNEVYFSPRWKAMLGYEDSELINEFSVWEELIDKDNLANQMLLIDDCMNGKSNGFVSEFRMRHKAGHWVYLLSRGVMVRDAQGKPLRMVGTHVDITEQKELEQQLRDSQVQANLIIDTAPEAIIMANSKSRIVRINPRVVEMFGYREEELLGQPVEILLPSAVRKAHEAYRDGYMEKPEYKGLREHGINRSLSGQRKDGTEFPVEAGLSPVLIGDEQHVVVTLMDISDRKSAEDALKNSEASLRKERDFVDAVVEAAGSIIVVLDHQGCIVRFNHAAEQITGYSFEELHDKPIWEFLIPEEVRPAVQGVFDNLAAGNIVGSYENEWLMKDGSRRMFDWRNTVLEDEHGDVTYVVSQGYDVTEIRSTQQALAVHKDKLEQLVAERTAQVRQQARIIDQSHDSIVTTDLEGNITSWNNGAEKVFGFQARDSIGQHISMVYPPDQRESLQQQVIQPLQQKGQHEMDVCMWRADHSKFDAHLSLSLIFDDEGEPTGMVGYSMDISERKQMENALRESEANLAHAQSIAHIGSWYLDLVNDDFRWSEETYHIFCIEKEVDINMGYFVASIYPGDTDRVMAAWEEALQGKAYDIEHRIIAGGREKWVRQVAEVSFNDSGEAISVLGTTQDITELKQAEKATQESLIEAQRLAQVRSEFVANMSHEIRTPLNAVLGLARMGERDRPGVNTKETFNRIMDSGQHLLRVVNDILDFSKIDAGKLKLESRPFKLMASVENAVNMIKEQAQDKSLMMDIEMNNELPFWVMGDPMRLEQILVNLLSNAVKFTEKGRVGLGVTTKNDELNFCVSDTGVGLSKTEITQLFKPFEQVDSSTTRRFGGTGLGLTISRNLARMMGGDILVSSHLDKGSEFTLSFPLQPATAQIESQGRPFLSSGGSRLKGVRVLAAEDIEVNRLVLADLLDQEGAHVLFTENGLQAVELVEEQGVNAFDLVLMDIQMPVMDGYSATRQILAIAPDLPVIGLTAHALTEERDRCLSSGMVDHVAKPVDVDILVSTMQRHILPPSGEAPMSESNNNGLAKHDGKDSLAQLDEADLVDWSALRERFQGRDDFINKLLVTMLKSQQDTPEKLRQAIRIDDSDQVYFLAHNLKSMAGNLKVERLALLARQTEVKVKEESADAFDVASEMATVLDQVLKVIKQKLNDVSG